MRKQNKMKNCFILREEEKKTCSKLLLLIVSLPAQENHELTGSYMMCVSKALLLTYRLPFTD